MPSSPEPVQPTPFEPARPEPEHVPPDTGGGLPRWVLPGLGGLLLLAVLVVFWLPRQVAEPALPGAAVSATPGVVDAPSGKPGAASGSATGADSSPWSDAQAARLRKEAQEVLAELLELQFALQERGVEQWAPAPFAAVAATASEGDELYRQREYEQATARYRNGLEQLQQLQETLPGEVDRQLEAARAAIESGDATAARAALDLATLMEPENAALAPLGERLAALPRLVELLEQAAAAEQGGDLGAARQLLQQAADLDGRHQRVAGELERVTLAHRQRQFNDAMSAGYADLDAQRFDSARAAFRKAGELQPESAEATSALQEVEAAQTAYRLAGLKRQGQEHERQEQWQQAVAAYERAQQIDRSVLFARDGLARSRDRARLDQQFRAAIDEPARLSDAAVARATEALLQEALTIAPRGPVLTQQVQQLERLLARANSPVTVTLQSDLATEVTVYKVARLGRFDRRELSLRPGTYTAVGHRNGYRDVRLEFTVTHDREPAPVTIACTEPI